MVGFAFVSFNGWRLIHANDRIKKFILKEVRPILGESCNIQNVSMGIGRIHLKGVSISLPDEQFSLYIGDLRIGYNLVDFLIHGFDTKNITQDLLIASPRLELIYRESPQRNKVDEPPELSFKDIEEKYDENLKQLRILRRLTVVDGEIYLRTLQGEKVQLANGIKGWLIPESPDSLQIALSGNLFTSKTNNLSIAGRVDMQKGSVVYAQAILSQYDLGMQIPHLIPKAIVFHKGLLNGSLSLSRSKAADRHFDIDGLVTVEGAEAHIFGDALHLENMDCEARIADWNIIFTKTSQHINGAAFDLFGQVRNILNPQVDLTFRSKDVDLGRFAAILGKPYGERFQGHGRATCTITGSLANPAMSTRIFANKGHFFDQPFDSLEVKARYTSANLVVEKCDFQFRGTKVRFSGAVDSVKNGDPIKGSLALAGDILPQLGSLMKRNLSSCPVWLNADFSGSLKKPVVTGDFSLHFVNKHNDSLASRAAFVIREDIATINSLEGNGSPKIYGRVNLKEQPLQFEFTVSKAQKLLSHAFALPRIDYLEKDVDVLFRIQGNRNRFDAGIELLRFEGGFFVERLALLEGEFREANHRLLADGAIVIRPDNIDPYIGQFAFSIDRKEILLDRLTFYDNIDAHYRTRNVPGSDIYQSGDISITDLKLNRILGVADSILSGTIDGDIVVESTRNSANVNGSLLLHDFYFNRKGPYSSELVFNVDSLGVHLERLEIKSKEATKIYVRGNYQPNQDNLDITVQGAGFDSRSLVRHFSTIDSLLSGQMIVDLKIQGSLKKPEVEGRVAVRNGKMIYFPFDELELTIGNTEQNIDNSAGKKFPEIHFNRIKILRSDDFVLVGEGILPMSLEDSLHITLEGKGDFLSLFKDVSPYFVHTESSGILTARLSGTFERPVLENARLQFEAGRMIFDSVVPEVTNLKGLVDFVPEEQFVHIRQLEGFMGGKWFRISNQLANDQLAERPIENLILGGDGFNLGVMSFETAEEGVPLNITGLMEADAFGQLQLSGYTPYEKFYFAGPHDRPLMRGLINLRDFRFMFPFDENASQPTGFIQDLLISIEWNVAVFGVKDVRYVKTLPGAFDNVYVNLQLEEKYGGLDFGGQVEDESFRIDGQVRSTSGIIEYLDMNFRVDYVGAEFDRSDLIPVVYGQARTTVTDSLGASSQIFLTMQTVDETMDKMPVDDIVRQEQGRGRWTDIRFKLSTDNPNFGATEAQILASLGYSTETLSTKAFDAVGIGTENYLFRPIFKPVERKIEQLFSLDYVRFSSRFTRNFIALNLNYNPQLDARLALLQSTKLVVGKYLSSQLFFQYTGQVETGREYLYQHKGVGLRHTLGMDYRINPQLMLELEYDYNSLILNDKEDKRIMLRHWFPF
ncbi:hypothetical protein A2V82_15955 [candidate division KSB1 bacterium RBG_16_48_16]|nr:MAG: hypothetical protein A2V82_15955 [candidate division KSB1 bacterium RBG_16_48_16]